MKLAFCLFTYFPYGGLQRDFLRIARVCKSRGHEIHIYTMSWIGEKEPEFNLHIIKANGLQNHSRIISFTRQLAFLLNQEAHDLVITFNKMPNALDAHKAPFFDLYYAADVCYQARMDQKSHFFKRLLPRYQHYRAFEKALFSRGQSTEIMLISQAQQAFFTHYYHTEPERFHLLPPGIAKDRLPPENAAFIRLKVRRELDINDQQWLLLMVGSGFKTKGLDRSIRALGALAQPLKKRCQLVVIGEDHKDYFLKLAKKLKVSQQVHFLGGRQDVSHFFLASDLLLHPAYHENTGTVLLEAAINGLPVLTTDVCGYAHYIRDAQLGQVLSSPFNQKDMNTMLSSMLETEDRTTWRENGLRFAKEADIYRLPEVAADIIEKKALQKNKTVCNEKWLSNSQFNFTRMMHFKGEIFREQKGRVTQRISISDQTYFLKQHKGVGFREIFKNLLQLRLPILGAKNEWLALRKLDSLGISVPKVIAYEQKGRNPARLKSYLLMQDLSQTISLEDLTKNWRNETRAALKHHLIKEIAKIVRTLHQNGINHRDLYLCHFLLDKAVLNGDKDSLKDSLFLIDLHRAQIRKKVPKRWIIKDLSALLFSCQHLSLTQRDLFRFIKHYQQASLRQIIKSDTHFWKTVYQRGWHYRDHTAK